MSGTTDTDTVVTSSISGAQFADGTVLSGTWTTEYNSTGTIVAISNATFTATGSGGTTTFSNAYVLGYANPSSTGSYEMTFPVSSGGQYNSLYVDWVGENPTTLDQGSQSLYTSIKDAATTTPDTPIRLTGSVVVNTGPNIANLPASQTGTDNTTSTPFGSISVTDTDPNAIISGSIILTSGGVATDADGLLSGAGITKTGVGTYTIAATTAGDLTNELQQVVFTPTAGQVSPGDSVPSTLGLNLNDGSGTTTANTVENVQAVTCFCAGTYIRTPDGDVAVERLHEGDLICTANGDVRPIRWIGFRHIDLTRHPAPERVQPIRIRAGAFADGSPCRDLRLSPDHAVLVNGLLVPIRLLVNGASILRETACLAITYFHVELDAHDIVLAENLPAESYLDTGNRNMFENANVPVLHADFSNDQARREAESCAPFAADIPRIKPIWDDFAARARQRGWQLPPPLPTTDDPALYIVANQQVIEPLTQTGRRYVFLIPSGSLMVHLVSHSAVPCDQRPWIEDQRQLGIMVSGLTIQTTEMLQPIPLDHPSLRQGWWDVELDGNVMTRWTDGNAMLTLPNASTVVLEVEVAGTLPYPVVQGLPNTTTSLKAKAA